MIGLISVAPRQWSRRTTAPERVRVLGVEFPLGTVGNGCGWAARRRMERTMKRLRARGVTALVPSAEFSAEAAAQWTLPLVDLTPLKRELAAVLVQAELEEKRVPYARARIGVWAAGPSGELVRAVTELSVQCRYLLLELPWGGETLCRQLRREYGVSIQLNPGWEQLSRADALALFDPPAKPEIRGLRLDSGGTWDLPPLALPPALEAQIPEAWDRNRLLAALRAAGALRPGQITAAARREDGTSSGSCQPAQPMG